MNLKVAFKYKLYDSKNAVLVFYAVILIVIALMFMFSVLIRDNSDLKGNMQGIEVASAIFLFVVGLNSFTEDFRMFMQNGISRRTMFISQIAGTIAISGIMALIDGVLALTGKLIFLSSDVVYLQGLLEMIYGHNIFKIGNFLLSVLFCFFLYIALMALGFLIIALYYRMNKGLKVTVSIGAPALFLVVVPIIDTFLLKGAIGSVLGRIIAAIFGNPAICMLTCFVLFAVFSALSWLLVRKAAVKD